MSLPMVEIVVALHHETEEAWLVSADGERRNAVWVAKSEGTIAVERPRSLKEHTLRVPEWLALEKGLI